MKPKILLAAVLALSACSSSTSDRPGASEERQAAIQRDRNEREARADAKAEAVRGETLYEGDEPLLDVDRDQAAIGSDTTEREAGREADNTGRNERDDEPGKLTASDQSNKASDVDITQAIRKKVVAEDGLSFNAKNVKIITVSGKVTLRGPVESSEESALIEKSARAVPGVVHVDNEIEIKR